MSNNVIRLCGRNDLAPGTARRFNVAGHRIAVARIDDRYYAVRDRCSHANYALSEGSVDTDLREIECPKHGSTFSLVTGEAQSLPATKPVPAYRVEVRGDDVMVQLPDPEGACTTVLPSSSKA